MSPVSVYHVESPLGPLRVAMQGGRLVAIGLPGEQEGFTARLVRRLPGTRTLSPTQPDPAAARLLSDLSRQLGLYFARLCARFSLPLSPRGTPFEQRVWRELQQIPFGQRRTYAEVGSALGSRRLARAVGRACARNPLPIVIPCHRVVASGGGLGGYSGGHQTKRLLLALESGPPATSSAP